jgi:hypothetical protein
MLGSQSWNDMSCVYVLRKLISRCPRARAREREREGANLIASYLYFCRFDGSYPMETTFPIRVALYSWVTVNIVLILQIYPQPGNVSGGVGG